MEELKSTPEERFQENMEKDMSTLENGLMTSFFDIDEFNKKVDSFEGDLNRHLLLGSLFSTAERKHGKPE